MAERPERGKIEMNCRSTSKDLSEPFPRLSRPLNVDFFSLSVGRMYDNNATSLRYFALPPASWFPLDLNPGMGKRIPRPESTYTEDLDGIMKYIFDNPRGVVNRNYSPESPKKLLPEFICFRDVLTTIMTTPYERRKDWLIQVTKYKGNFYLIKRETERETHDRKHPTTEAETEYCYRYRFNQYCLRKKPDEVPNPNDDVDESTAFCCIFNTTIDDCSLFYCAEMDGINHQHQLPLDLDPYILQDLSFVALRTRFQGIEREDDGEFKRQLSLEWWCKFYLASIRDLRIGRRDKNGKVTRIDQYEVQQLPKMCSELWYPNITANFLVKFLKMLRKFMAKVNEPYVVYEFHFHAESGQLYYKIIRARSGQAILEDWFVKFLNRIYND